MRIEQFQDKCRLLRKKYGISDYEIKQRFMFDEFLKCVCNSKYHDNFVLKGGLFLTIVFGIQNRMTRDADISVNKIPLSKASIKKIINEIIKTRNEVSFSLVNINKIHDKDIYGGYTCTLVGKFINLAVSFSVDITTNDIVTPAPMDYCYKSIFDHKTIYIKTYNAESILSEKIETILRRGKYNSRMKDYYDVYMLLNNKYNKNILKDAIFNTFRNRNSLNYLDDYKIILNDIKSSEKLHLLWEKYKRKNSYARNIDFVKILNKLMIILRDIFLVSIA